jgi:prevent-host-death family protein
MGDHLNDSTRSGPIQKLVGVRELKANAARILRHVRESRTSFILTHRGRAVAVILPFDPIESHSQAGDDSDAAAAWDTFTRAGRRLERRFRPGLSGVRMLSAMRR